MEAQDFVYAGCYLRCTTHDVPHFISAPACTNTVCPNRQTEFHDGEQFCPKCGSIVRTRDIQVPDVPFVTPDRAQMEIENRLVHPIYWGGGGDDTADIFIDPKPNLYFAGFKEHSFHWVPPDDHERKFAVDAYRVRVQFLIEKLKNLYDTVEVRFGIFTCYAEVEL